jgi:hypothetical protein
MNGIQHKAQYAIFGFTLWAAAGFPLLAGGQVVEMPGLNPPRMEIPEMQSAVVSPAPQEAALASEWLYHKTPDGRHPDGPEQQAVWLMNQARRNPLVEGAWLATSSDPEVAFGRDYFHVDTGMLQSEFAVLPAKPPAAFDVRLYQAARVHAEDLAARDAQDHDQQFARVAAAGFSYNHIRGSVFAYAGSALNAHAAWNIDWGPGPGNMQTGRGHRQATMAGDGDYVNVGLAMLPENNSSTHVGPVIAVGNYASARTSVPNHLNRFVVGTVWSDADQNGMYDPDEGIGDVMVSADQGAYYAVTAASGGYAFPATVSGVYQLTFTGSRLAAPVSYPVSVGSESVLADLKVGTVAPPPNPDPDPTPNPNPTPDPNPNPSPTPNPGANWAGMYEQFLENPDDVDLYREFRDRILMESAWGRTATAAIYRRSDALLAFLNDHPDLMRAAGDVMRENRDAVAEVLDGGVGVIQRPEHIVAFLHCVEKRDQGDLARWCRFLRGVIALRIGADTPFLGFVVPDSGIH